MTRDRRSEVLMRELRHTWAEPDASPVAVRRLAANLTQGELGERAGISRATIERVERTGRATDATFWRLSRALGCAREEIDPAYARRVPPFEAWMRCDG